MAETLDQSWNTDDLRVDVHTPYVLAYWANQFGIAPDDLRIIVTRVGPVLRNVKKELDDAALSRRGLTWDQCGVDRRRGSGIVAAS